MGTKNESTLNERWLPVVGYEGWYDVSNMGRIRRAKTSRGATRLHIIGSQKEDRGYLITRLHKHGGRYRVRVHSLVATAFLGSRPDGMQVNHIDGIKTNNNADNLEYVAPLENIHHALRLGLRRQILSVNDVYAIRELLKEQTQTSIARTFGVTQTAISYISTGTNWGWLQDESAVT